jgi:4-hydroxythreonine-4-phosphate dehydrogenase
MSAAASALPLAISTGDPGGVGPEIALRACMQLPADDRAVVYGDPEALRARLGDCGMPADRVREIAAGREDALPPGAIGIAPTATVWDAEARRHEPTTAGGRAQLEALEAALAAALAGRVRALVTAPMSKAAVNLSGAAFTGHTEHLARAAGLADDDVTMMFLGPRLKVALATTHLAVADLPRAITRERVLRSVRHMVAAMTRLQRGAETRLQVTGLNPHAGESGLFGDEEAHAIAPAIEEARALPEVTRSGVRIEGPVPAETAFRLASVGEVGGVVAMMHDQATIASKILDWGDAVNVTWGLPFVRTSVDHGVAYDAAAAGRVDARGMLSALALARRLTGS